MASDDKKDFLDDDFDPEQFERIERLKEQAKEIAGGEMDFYEAEDVSPDVQEQFWQNVIAFETGEYAPLFDRLVKAGIELPPPDDLNDFQLHAKLWEVIHALQMMRVFLEQTDHLSDRELYAHLWSDTLREEMFVMPDNPDFHCGIDILGSYGEEEIYLYLKYYADEEWREKWATDWPNDEIPPHEDPPYDRDRLLPKPEFPIPDQEM